jgi:integrase
MPRKKGKRSEVSEQPPKTRVRRDWGGTIYQRKDRPGGFWWAKWRDSTGKVHVLNTKTTDKTAAERQLAIETGKVATDTERGVRAVTLTDFWKEVEPLAKARLAHRQFPNHRAQVLRCADAFPNVSIYEIQRPSLEAYFLKIKTEGKRKAAPDGEPHTGPIVPLSHATLVRHRAALGFLWAQAIERGAALVNVPLSVPISTFGKRQEREAAYFTPEQLRKLYAKLPSSIEPLVVLLGELGARFAEIAGEHRKGQIVGGLRWDQVAADDSAVTFANTKNGRVRTVPTTARARTVLAALRKARIVPLRGEDLVLANHATSNTFVRGEFDAAVAAAGLPKCGIHALRHTYAAGLVSAGVPLNVVMQLCGHSSLALVTRYGRHAPAEAGVLAVRALERTRASGKGRRRATGSATAPAARRARRSA